MGRLKLLDLFLQRLKRARADLDSYLCSELWSCRRPFSQHSLRNLGRAYHEAMGLYTQADHEMDLEILQEICGRGLCQIFRHIVGLLVGSSADWPT
jgi:hypothetical protein